MEAKQQNRNGIAAFLIDPTGWGHFAVRLVLVSGIFWIWMMVQVNIWGGSWSVALPNRELSEEEQAAQNLAKVEAAQARRNQ